MSSINLYCSYDKISCIISCVFVWQFRKVRDREVVSCVGEGVCSMRRQSFSQLYKGCSVYRPRYARQTFLSLREKVSESNITDQNKPTSRRSILIKHVNNLNSCTTSYNPNTVLICQPIYLNRS